MYTLDKFRDRPELADHEFYVIDGEHKGGVTRFINHSCDPNCRQYAVSYNKHDWFVYELAFFAVRDIPAGEELTFDYLGRDDDIEEEDWKDSQEDEPVKDRVPCKCGSVRCRRWLWL